ncbi:MAG: hypothetical protein RIM99_01350 [Cyclobacteriaceae bacterium]
MKKTIYLLFGTILLFSCSKPSGSETAAESEVESEYVEFNNPPADGFNQEGSDLIATILADKVMVAMGGRKAWDDTRYITWNFFGRRTHTWDKHEGNVRIEEPSKNLIILININSREGRVQLNGEEIIQPDSLSKYLDLGNRYWINDSYWLVMPYKLKDSGVTLTYVGEVATEEGVNSDVVRLTFEDVGVTPDNVYDVWVDFDSKLVTQWAYYPKITDEKPQFITPWTDYKQYGEIMLSGKRGEYELSNINVLEEVPDGTFDSFEVPVQ